MSGAFKSRFRKVSHEFAAADQLHEFFVWWDGVTPEDIKAFEAKLQQAQTEQELQAFLEQNPHLLIEHLGGGHGRWVIPHKRLGSEHVTDFLIGDKCSFGYSWYAVELEHPSAGMFTKTGDPSAALTHAIRQINDWRCWLTQNISYSSAPIVNGGLGLTDIDGELPGLVIIGRRSHLNDDTKMRRRRMSRELNIDIHTYDWLLESAAGRVDWFATRLGQAEVSASSDGDLNQEE